jgi:hypothetical protein
MRTPLIVLDALDVGLLDECVEVDTLIVQYDAVIRNIRGREDVAAFSLEVILETWGFDAVPYNPDFSTIVSVCYAHTFRYRK